MEIKAELIKPYTDEQRIRFIVEYNHKQGCMIELTETSIIAWKQTEEEKQTKEKERIKSLTMTKRNFAIALRDYFQIPYQTLKQTIARSDDAQLEWDLCVELHRNNPLLDIMAGQMGITPKQLDYIFQKANGEDVEIEV